MVAERAERWDKLDLKPKRWWGYTILLFILGTILPPLGTYRSNESFGLSLTPVLQPLRLGLASEGISGSTSS
jgi:hypothetical protein